MGFWTDLGNFACSCVFFVGNVIVDTALTVTEYIQKAAGANVINGYQNQRIDIKRGLHDLNLQLQDLLRQRAHDGRLSRQNEDREKELLERRNNEKEKLWALKEAESTEKITNNPTTVNSTIITPDNPHVLQYHIGQITKNKICPNCGSMMVLNFRRLVGPITMNDLIWTCVSYYFQDQNNAPCPPLPYNHSDGKLFANENIEEFKCTNNDLTTIFQATQKDVLSRIDNYRNQTIKDSYLCPFHGAELVLRKTRDAIGALNQYFLACPYFNFGDPNGPDSCRYKVTLKSPAQLAAALRRFEGRGIL